MNNFGIEILSPQGLVFKGEILSASFPTANGIITVLPGHEGLVTNLKHGEIILESSDGVKEIAITGGFAEITNKNINVIAEFAANSDETNKHKIEQAVKLAKEIKEKRKNFVDMSVIETELKKSVAELKSGIGLKRKGM
ncbi:MAG: ATP synthase F1 subunit epsilon [Endomicrobium sp.]|jgi:F-type H+-transporting ATPase subunit epsilon|nr:ATP synthase F1 subunit epsilon [Endomicrobium sp.]